MSKFTNFRLKRMKIYFFPCAFLIIAPLFVAQISFYRRTDEITDAVSDVIMISGVLPQGKFRQKFFIVFIKLV